MKIINQLQSKINPKILNGQSRTECIDFGGREVKATSNKVSVRQVDSLMQHGGNFFDNLKTLLLVPRKMFEGKNAFKTSNDLSLYEQNYCQ